MSQDHLLIEYKQSVTDDEGRRYRARAVGAQAEDGLWEGWLEFTPENGSAPSVSTPRETVQPNLMDAEYWASGLQPVYLEGALGRALAAERGQVFIPRSRRLRRAAGAR